eukprot:SAG31_NODE_23349_length_506_cov_0.869779_1_plen_35_part_10
MSDDEGQPAPSGASLVDQLNDLAENPVLQACVALA